MLKREDIAEILPVDPYASYESQCALCRKTDHPTQLYFIQGSAFSKKVHSDDYNLFYLNLSEGDTITGHLTCTMHGRGAFAAEAGQIVTIVPAGDTVTYEMESPYQQAVMCIHKNVLNEKAVEYTKGEFNKADVIASGPVDSPFLASVFREIEKVQLGQVTHDHLYLESLYDVAMAKILNHYTSMKKDMPLFKMHSPAHLKKVMDYIYNNLDKDIKVAELAVMMGLSQYHFTRVFKEYLGTSPYQYILNVRFEKSKDYLSQTDLPLVSIANMLGFSSQSHFQGFFKKQMGQTPQEYRQNVTTSNIAK